MRVVAIALCLALAACSQGRQEAEPGNAESAVPVVQPTATLTAPAATPEPALPRITGRYSTRDECSALTGWQPFAAAVRAAVVKRDSRAFAALASDGILLDFGGGAGQAELVKRLDDRSARSLWEELDQLVALGCAKVGGGQGASMPWFWEQDLGGADPFEVWLVTGAAVPLLSAADPEAPPRASLGWVLVEPVKQYAGQAPFQNVRLVGRSEQGYVESRYLRSQIDYRLISERIGGTWRITHLIAGD